MGADVVVLPAIVIQPELELWRQRPAPVEGALQGAMEAFDLALVWGWRMPLQ